MSLVQEVLTKIPPSYDRSMKTLVRKDVEIRKRDAALYDLMELWRNDSLSGLEKDRAIKFFYEADVGLIVVGRGVQKALLLDAPVSLRDDLKKYTGAVARK